MEQIATLHSSGVVDPLELAIHGGSKTIRYSIPPHNPIGIEEKAAVEKVLESGILSKFVGAWGEDFYGGPRVQEFEREWSNYFEVKHSVSVNSATSGLIVALGAIGLEPGDEVILSPWTMSADAAAILVWNAIPVFADIETETFNLDPIEIEKKISSRTKAILVSDIFGHPAKFDEILRIAKKNKLFVIEDAAQSPGAKFRNQSVGTLADIGIFSLNYHKHIHTGEGGVCVTNNSRLFERMQLIRNHSESVVEKKGETDLSNMIGFNFRMGEIEAAIGLEQLKKLESILIAKREAADHLTISLRKLEGLQTPQILPHSTHSFYVYPLVLNFKEDSRSKNLTRADIVRALSAEGIPGVSEGYVNLHLLPLFQKKIAYGKSGFPWSLHSEQMQMSYQKGICPKAEELHEKSFFKIALCSYRFSPEDVQATIRAFEKVWAKLVQKRGRDL